MPKVFPARSFGSFFLSADMEHDLSEGGFGEGLVGKFKTPDCGHESAYLGLAVTALLSERSKTLSVQLGQLD